MTIEARDSWLRRHASTLALWLIVLLGGGLRFFMIGDKTIWLDEALTLWPAQQGLREGWRWLIQVDAHPPVYYALLHAWLRLFGDLPAAVRGLSAVCGTLALPLYCAAARRMVDRPTALLATFILAIAPFHVRHAQEVRMYAFLTLLVAISLYLLSRIVFDREDRPVLWLGLALSEAAAMLTHNTALLFPLALNVGVLAAIVYQAATGRSTSLPIANAWAFGRRWLAYQALALVLWLPWVIALMGQTSMLYQRHWIPFPSARIVWKAFENFSFSSIPRGFPFLSYWIALYLLLALAGVIWLRRKKANAALLVSLFVTPIVAELVISLKRPMFLDRTLIWATLAYYLLIAAGMRGLGAARWRGTAAQQEQRAARQQVVRGASALLPGALLVIIATLSCFALAHYYFEYKNEEWATAARYVARRARPGDVIVFNTILGQVPFEYYFRHYKRRVEMRGLPVDLRDRTLPEPTMTADDLQHAYQLLNGRERVWLVYSHQGYTDPERLVWRVLASEMRPAEERGFVGLKVVLFERQARDAALPAPK